MHTQALCHIYKRTQRFTHSIHKTVHTSSIRTRTFHAIDVSPQNALYVCKHYWLSVASTCMRVGLQHRPLAICFLRLIYVCPSVPIQQVRDKNQLASYQNSHDIDIKPHNSIHSAYSSNMYNENTMSLWIRVILFDTQIVMPIHIIFPHICLQAYVQAYNRAGIISPQFSLRVIVS